MGATNTEQAKAEMADIVYKSMLEALADYEKARPRNMPARLRAFTATYAASTSGRVAGCCGRAARDASSTRRKNKEAPRGRSVAALPVRLTHKPLQKEAVSYYAKNSGDIRPLFMQQAARGLDRRPAARVPRLVQTRGLRHRRRVLRLRHIGPHRRPPRVPANDSQRGRERHRPCLHDGPILARRVRRADIQARACQARREARLRT